MYVEFQVFLVTGLYFQRKTRLLRKKYKVRFHISLNTGNYLPDSIIYGYTNLSDFNFLKLHIVTLHLHETLCEGHFLVVKDFLLCFVLVFFREVFLIIQVFVCFMLISEIMFA